MKTLAELKELIAAEKTRGYNLKTKKAKQKSWDKRHELEREALNILYAQLDKNGPQSLKATVLTFRPGDDHFLVKTSYGNMWVSPTGDVLTKSWYPHTCCVEYTVGQEIVMEFSIEVNHDKFFLEIIPDKMHGGKVNEEQYNELCKKDNLAFFKYPNTDGVTGLFSK